MNLLDRYIARQYVANIVLLFVLLFSIVVLIDFSLNFDEFTDLAERLVKDWGWPDTLLHRGALSAALVLDLWWPRLFQLFYYLLGLVLVGAMGFTCAQFVRHRELVAMLAGGVSLHRVARPILIVALGACVLQTVDSEYVLPRLAPLLTRDKKEAGKHELGAARVPLCADSAGRLLYARSFDPDRGVIEGLWVWERDADGLLTRRITADRAAWRDGAWVLENGKAESRRPGAQAGQRSIEPLDALRTDLDPTALTIRRFEGYRSNLSVAQVASMLRSLKAAPRPPENRIEQLERTRFGRPAVILCNLLTLLICMPFFVRREPVNMLVQSMYCAPVAITALVGGLLGTTASIPGLPPQVGPFVPAMILIPVAIMAVSSVRT